jgi:hypothetical protein
VIFHFFGDWSQSEKLSEIKLSLEETRNKKYDISHWGVRASPPSFWCTKGIENQMIVSR